MPLQVGDYVRIDCETVAEILEVRDTDVRARCSNGARGTYSKTRLTPARVAVTPPGSYVVVAVPGPYYGVVGKVDRTVENIVYLTPAPHQDFDTQLSFRREHVEPWDGPLPPPRPVFRYEELQDGRGYRVIAPDGTIGEGGFDRACGAVGLTRNANTGNMVDRTGQRIDFGLTCGCLNSCRGNRCRHAECRNKCYKRDAYCRACRQCSGHCRCVECGNCSSKTVEVCAECKSGTSCCCRCVVCNGCRARQRSGVCENCSVGNCCHAKRGCESYKPRLKEGRPFHVDRANQRKHFKCTRTIGVEWEYNEASNFTAIGKWGLKWRGGHHSDGSCGWEVVTAPLAGDHIAKCLSELGEAFEESDARANESCGIHVHVDAADMRWPDMYRLVRVYSQLEPLLYIIGGANRVKNSYARPSGMKFIDALKSAEPKERLLSMAYRSEGAIPKSEMGKFIKSYQPGKKGDGRYRGLNICPWVAGRQGKKVRPDTTVEFRIHRNTLDANRVIGWAQLCARLVDWCAKHTQKDVEALPKSPLRALLQISPDSKEYVLRRIRAWRRAVQPKRRQIRIIGAWKIAA